jgi:hypothetical protein
MVVILYSMGILVAETLFDTVIITVMVANIVFVDLAKSARYFVVGRYRNEVNIHTGNI